MRRSCLHSRDLLAGVIAVAACLPNTVAYAQVPSGPAPVMDNPAAAGVEVMTRGPIHEAFAQPVNSGVVRPLLAPKKPPEPIDEVPPDAKPAGEQTAWIGGYWAWDDDRKNFSWISGVWRVPPPGQRWIAGYWTEVPGGYSWVSGFWSPVDQQEVAYYPEPPASLEQGPTSDPPSADVVWVSGCWRWTDAGYAWQPGYWAEAQPDWVWVSASYYWSPRGWVFRDAYRDYRLDRRGLLFAPVYFSSDLYRRPGYFYSPSVVIDSSLLTFYLFVRPNYSHYYFGDYYAANYDGLGIYPWFGVRRHVGYAYDPLFAYYGWRNRVSDPHWARNLQNWHAYYRAHPDQRLPHNLADARRIAEAGGQRRDRQFLNIADSLQNWRNRPGAVTRLDTVSPEQKTRFRETARLTRQFGTERSRMEAAGTATAGDQRGPSLDPNAAGKQNRPETLTLPRVARSLPQGAPTRMDGRARQVMKPILPSSPTQRTDQATSGIRRPSIPSQPQGREVEPRRAREQRQPQGAFQGGREQASPQSRRMEQGGGGDKPRGGDKGAQREGRGRR
ncbi:MAG TPA: hypothetical protein VJL29_13670 [Thermoguttaceae bacterium]|nr:hypothetical protein [Thermoguttaceae bacterium]